MRRCLLLCLHVDSPVCLLTLCMSRVWFAQTFETCRSIQRFVRLLGQLRMNAGTNPHTDMQSKWKVKAYLCIRHCLSRLCLSLFVPVAACSSLSLCLSLSVCLRLSQTLSLCVSPSAIAYRPCLSGAGLYVSFLPVFVCRDLISVFASCLYAVCLRLTLSSRL